MIKSNSERALSQSARSPLFHSQRNKCKINKSTKRARNQRNTEGERAKPYTLREQLRAQQSQFMPAAAAAAVSVSQHATASNKQTNKHETQCQKA